MAGFYDPRDKKMYLMNWLPAKTQQPVLAHELAHALQDQNFGLYRYMRIQDAADEKLSEGELNEQRSVRRAVVEGQAMCVMFDYQLAPYGKSMAQLPSLPSELIQKMVDRYSNTFVMQRAPLIFRESAVFTYFYGFEFMHQLVLKSGKDQAYAKVFKDPPRSSRQIMEPATYLSGEDLPALKMPSLDAALGSNYQKFDEGIIGEFDSLVFLKQFGSAEQAKQVTPQWRGGYYYAARRIGKTEGKGDKLGPGQSEEPHAKDESAEGAQGAVKTSGSGPLPLPIHLADVALLYVSRWATPAAASDFADVYRASVPVRYPGAKTTSAAGEPTAKEKTTHWNTSDGFITVNVKGNQVVAVESFDETTAAKILLMVP